MTTTNTNTNTATNANANANTNTNANDAMKISSEASEVRVEMGTWERETTRVVGARKGVAEQTGGCMEGWVNRLINDKCLFSQAKLLWRG